MSVLLFIAEEKIKMYALRFLFQVRILSYQQVAILYTFFGELYINS